MEKATGAGSKAGHRRETASGALFALAVCMGCPASWAQDAGRARDQAVAEAQVARIDGMQVQVPAGRARVQVQTSVLPRLDAQDGGYQAPRVDVSLLPTRRSWGFSPVFGVGGIVPQHPIAGLAPMRPSIDLGLRWSQRLSGQQRVDITAWRRMNTDDDAYTLAQMQQPVYGARLELNLSPAHKAGFALDHGFVGMQLESGARISVKRKDGHPMIYYRSSF